MTGGFCADCDRPLMASGWCRSCSQKGVPCPGRSVKWTRARRRAQTARLKGNQHLLGYKHSAATRAAMSAARKGKKLHMKPGVTRRGVRHTPEWKKRASEWMKGNQNGRGGKGKPGKRHTAAWIARAMKWLRKGPRETAIEKRVRLTLTAMKEPFRREKFFKGVGRVDFYIPRYNVVVECDGEYWHSRPGAALNDARRDFVLRTVYRVRVVRLTERFITAATDAQLSERLGTLAGGRRAA